MLASLAIAFTNLAEASTVLPPGREQQVVATALDEDAQLMSNTALDALLVNQPPEIEAEIIRINTEARPIALQVALLVPLLAGRARPHHLVPDDAAAGRQAVGRPGGAGAGLTAALWRASGPATANRGSRTRPVDGCRAHRRHARRPSS